FSFPFSLSPFPLNREVLSLAVPLAYGTLRICLRHAAPTPPRKQSVPQGTQRRGDTRHRSARTPKGKRAMRSV
ncbi:hypothetical protein, partial [Nostoc sp. UHCC 0251]|uniref:hypothetical protein n=1 Tax=Nostoc sp. UHCC 0251 TaxID=3110240 RepID=UPI002B20A1E3